MLACVCPFYTALSETNINDNKKTFCLTVRYRHGTSCVTVQYRHGTSCVTVQYRHGTPYRTVLYRHLITTLKIYQKFNHRPKNLSIFRFFLFVLSFQHRPKLSNSQLCTGPHLKCLFYSPLWQLLQTGNIEYRIWRSCDDDNVNANGLMIILSYRLKCQ